MNVTAIASAMGSAIYTPVTLSEMIFGIIYIRGTKSTNFLVTATIIEQTALPIETNAIWQAVWIPNINKTAQ